MNAQRRYNIAYGKVRDTIARDHIELPLKLKLGEHLKLRVLIHKGMSGVLPMLAVLEENKNVRTEASLQFARPVVNGSPITTHMRKYVIDLEFLPNPCIDNELRFEDARILCWIDELFVSPRFGNITGLTRYLGVSAMMVYRVMKAA